MVKLKLWGYTVDSVLSDSSFAPAQRDLDAAELWAGCKAVARAVQPEQGVAETVEIADDYTNQDLTTEDGFVYAAKLVMRIKVGGLLAMAPVCSSWVFANMVNTKRSKADPAGDRSYGPVVQGNIMAKVAAFFLLLAYARELFAFMENPAASMIFRYSPVKLAVDFLTRAANGHFVIFNACRYSELPLGQRSKKPFKVFAIGKISGWLCPLRKLCNCGDFGHVPLMVVDSAGKATGSKAMKGSQHYSDTLGKDIVKAWCHAKLQVQLGNTSAPHPVRAKAKAKAAGKAKPQSSFMPKPHKRPAANPASSQVWKRRADNLPSPSSGASPADWKQRQ